jgi:hypothetical protein
LLHFEDPKTTNPVDNNLQLVIAEKEKEWNEKEKILKQGLQELEQISNHKVRD